MKYQSTTGKGLNVSFKQAVLGNLPGDGGLFFPESIPSLDKGFLSEVPSMELHEVASQALLSFCEEDIDQATLEKITKKVFHFPIPIQKVSDNIHCLELFHGPTYAFKDVGAKFLAECLAYFNAGGNKETTVLVATSGDTGGAVANGFLGVEGVKVIILYPKGKVSELQEKQLTTLGQNITALEVEGTFDDCQDMVKEAFADEDLNNEFNLSSANSINIARWLPQSIYYYAPLMHGFENVTISVPSGNYGNLTAGALAMKMDVPFNKFIAASNANDVVPRYLTSSVYDPKATIPTIANAMDVGDPSNYKRLQALFNTKYEEIKRKLEPFTLQDSAIKRTIRSCYEEHGYILDPHSAIAYEALNSEGGEGIFLGTAHYCKFLPVLNEALCKEVQVPEFALDLMKRKKKSIEVKAEFSELKEYLRG